MVRWSSSVEIRFDEVFGQTISVSAKSYLGAVVKREATLLLRRATEFLGIRDRRYDLHRGIQIIHVNRGSRRTRKFR